jgi:protein involved in polysaccharide export with SLBB domain
MGWKSVLFGFAAVAALAICSWAQGAPAAAQGAPAAAQGAPAAAQGAPASTAPPKLLQPAAQPRYATMIAPSDDELPPERLPLPAPTTPVTVAQAPQPAPQRPVEAVQLPAAPVMPAASRYATQEPPHEQIVVNGLRPSDDGLYHLGTGDKVRITVFNEGDLSGEFVIDSQGYLRLPLIGPVQAAGLSSTGLESRLAASYEGGGFLIRPRVAVEITGYRPFYIIGEVAKPGEYPYVNGMSAPNAVALAGGFTDRAVESNFWVRRQGEAKERRLPIDETTRIYPGDVVRVERSTYWSIMTLLSPLISPFATTAYLLK